MVRTLFWVSLLLAFVYGQMSNKQKYESMLLEKYPAAGEIQPISKKSEYSMYSIGDSDRKNAVVSDGNGYGGKIIVSSLIKSSDNIEIVSSVDLISDFETRAYVERLKNKYFFRQFVGRRISSDFVLGRDVDSYSGATVTAKAVVEAVRKGVHGYATDVSEAEPSWQPPQWQFTIGELSTLLLVLAALLTSIRRETPITKIVKRGLPIASLIFIGFYNNASISLGSLGSILLGYFPGIRSHPIWWMMMTSILVGVLFLGKNIYCSRLCPFSVVQSILNSISGIKWKVPKIITKNSRKIVLSMMWAGMMLIFISKHPSLGSYEPFSMMFSLEGYGFQWYILPLALFGTVFIPEFWCRLFCPVGLALNESVKFRRKAINKLTIKLKNVK